MIGKVVSYYPARKYGFIRYGDSVSQEIFFHAVELRNFEPEKGVLVEFETGEFQNRKCAIEIRRHYPTDATIQATAEEIELIRSYGVDLSKLDKVRAALETIRTIARKHGEG